MKVRIIEQGCPEEVKGLFLDVFSNEPWFDKWESDKQVNSYLRDLMENNNSLSLALYDENEKLVSCSLGYVFHWWEGKEYFIKEFFVSREMQNKGIGGIFLEKINHLLQEKGIAHILLSTEKDVPAYHFYQKNGFSVQENAMFLVKKVNKI